MGACMKNETLYKHQYGFRKNYSTKLSLINLINDVIKSIDKGMVNIGIFIDFKKAFDTINHTILFKKLEHYGVQGVPLQWFKDYLADRFQFVSCNEVLSEYKPITCGVTQGVCFGTNSFSFVY